MIDKEWLKRKIEADPDCEVEAGTMHSDAPMTHDTDALVSEQTKRLLNGASLLFLHGHQAEADAALATADAIVRLTRELGEALEERDSATLAWSQALTERDAARTELAECRNKALEEAAAKVPTNWLHPDVAHMLGGGQIMPSAVELAMQKVVARIRALKEFPHV